MAEADNHPLGLSEDGESLIEGTGEYDFDVEEDEDVEETPAAKDRAWRGLRVFLHRS